MFFILITCLLNSVLILWGKVRCRSFTALFFGSQVIAVILAVFFHQGNGRTITSTSNDNIVGMLDLAEEELNTLLNETNEDPTEREENQVDVLRIPEADLSSYQVFSSDNMIQPKEASPVLRQKGSPLGPCYTGNFQRVRLASGGLQAFPICRKFSLTGCVSSLSSNQQKKRLCVGSLTMVLVRGDDGTNHLRVFNQSCSCAAWNHTSQ